MGGELCKLTEKEDHLQIACMEWMAYQHPNINAFHVPNGGRRAARIIKGKRVCLEGAKLKRMGAKAGVCDILILEPRGVYHGMCIELKTLHGKLTEAQGAFIDACSKSGYWTSVERSLEGFMACVNNYLRL